MKIEAVKQEMQRINTEETKTSLPPEEKKNHSEFAKTHSVREKKSKINFFSNLTFHQPPKNVTNFHFFKNSFFTKFFSNSPHELASLKHEQFRSKSFMKKTLGRRRATVPKNFGFGLKSTINHDTSPTKTMRTTTSFHHSSSSTHHHHHSPSRRKNRFDIPKTISESE